MDKNAPPFSTIKSILSIIIPCYNEADGIPQLSEKLTPILHQLQTPYQLELLFIDDGSTDNTSALLKQHFPQPYTKIIKHDTNKNLGASIRTGFAHATGDILITMDSDCTYDPQEIFALLNLLDEQTSLVTVSPYHPLGKVENIPKYRLWLSKSISWIYRHLTGENIYTFTALFRAQKKHLAKTITFQSDNFLANAEILIYSLLQGHTIKEHPSPLHVRKYGQSKMRLFIVIKSHAQFVLKIVWYRISGKFSKKDHRKKETTPTQK